MTAFCPPFRGLPNLNEPFNWGDIYWLPTIWRALSQILWQSSEETVRRLMELALLKEKMIGACFHLLTVVACPSAPINTKKVSRLVWERLANPAHLHQTWKCLWALLSVVYTNWNFIYVEETMGILNMDFHAVLTPPFYFLHCHDHRTQNGKFP